MYYICSQEWDGVMDGKSIADKGVLTCWQVMGDGKGMYLSATERRQFIRADICVRPAPDPSADLLAQPLIRNADHLQSIGKNTRKSCFQSSFRKQPFSLGGRLSACCKSLGSN